MKNSFKLALFVLGSCIGWTSGSHADEKCPVVDVVVGRLKSGTVEKKFLVDSSILDHHLKKQKGFISRKLFKVPETNQWMDILCWESEEEGKKAVDVVHGTPACGAFLNQWEEKYDLYHGVRK